MVHPVHLAHLVLLDVLVTDTQNVMSSYSFSGCVILQGITCLEEDLKNAVTTEPLTELTICSSSGDSRQGPPGPPGPTGKS